MHKIILNGIMALNTAKFMNENFLANNIENNNNINKQESDYKNLITRLKEIKTIITLLENITSK